MRNKNIINYNNPEFYSKTFIKKNGNKKPNALYYLSLDTFDDDARSKLLNSDKYFKDNGGVNTPMVLIVKNNKMVAYIDELVNSSEYIKLFKDNGLINKK